MATWDGSYSGPEDPNYYSFANQDSTNSASDDWGYYSTNGSNLFPQDTHNYYQNQSAMYEPSGSSLYHQVQQNVMPAASNLASTGMNLQHMLPNRSSVSTNVQSYNDSNPPAQNFVSPYYRNYNKSTNYSSRPKNKDHRFVYNQKSRNVSENVLDHSNLHATANEFVPNGIRSDDERSNTSYRYRSKHDSAAQNSQPASHSSNNESEPKAFYADNRIKQEKQQQSRKGTYYGQREAQSNKFQVNGAYKKSYKGEGNKTYSRSYADKYYNNKQQGIKSRKEPQINESQKSSLEESAGTAPLTSQGTSDNDQCIVENSKSTTNANTNRKVDKKTINSSPSLKDNTQHSSKSRKFKAQTSDSVPQENNSDMTYFHGVQKNYKKRYESSYRDRKNDYQDNNSSRSNYSRDSKVDRSYDKNKLKNVGEEHQEKLTENWRQKGEGGNRSYLLKRTNYKQPELDDDASQRERLTDQLNRGQVECLVCCEYIRQNDSVWSCSNCYHVLHLKCVQKWAKSSQADNDWKCPACRNVNSVIPEEYYCFCGKLKSPDWNRRDIAHSCGEVCGRTRVKNNCVHKCTLLCHPGACPVCVAMVTKKCGCGRMSQTLQCDTVKLLVCDSVCGKPLNCGRHTCERTCHHDECGLCEKTVEQDCFCGKNTREVKCELNVPLNYSCGNVCDRTLNCNNHKCKQACHAESCGPCLLSPDRVTTCWCGQTPLTEERKSCLDPIPICDKICSKPLKCGQPSKPHTCNVPCHEGECPGCDLTTDVRCRCGNMDREIACKDLTTKADDARCERKCTKKRSCGKHKCNQMCCIDLEHICPLPCNKTLSCGRHRCEQTCHKGRCQPCWRSSFDELYCECGAAVIYPPVPCGTRRPTCDMPCSREHPCGHQVLHNCHSDSVCPPCTVLTQKWCYGNHELRKAVPCHVNEISCGLACNKPLSCGRHKCILTCHSGVCEKPGQQCVQPCTTPRELCGHICAAPCHEGSCPNTPCKEIVKVTCQCGHRSTTRPCEENAREYQRIASSVLASKMAEMQLGHSVNLEEVFGQGAKKQNQLKTLECNDECKIIERNRRLALGLQIVNPDLSGKLMPRYSDFMKQWAKKDASFCQMVHDKLTELVQLSKTSKHKCRSYSFECMNRDKRHFVHEYCTHFGCESQAYDKEPKRNIVATAVKDKCWMPSYSLMEIVQRENGQRKAPGPMLNTTKDISSVKTVLSLPSKSTQKTLPLPATALTSLSTLASTSTFTSSKPEEPEIDYFDYKG